MRAYKILVTGLALCVIGTLSMCIIVEYFLGDSGKYVALPGAMMLGLFSRRIVEKCYGMTLKEAQALDNGGSSEKQ